jgi:hypothetical protein
MYMRFIKIPFLFFKFNEDFNVDNIEAKILVQMLKMLEKIGEEYNQ